MFSDRVINVTNPFVSTSDPTFTEKSTQYDAPAARPSHWQDGSFHGRL